MEKFISKKFSDGDKMMFELGLSPEFRTKIMLSSQKLIQKFNTIKSNVQELERIRQKL